jgi:type IV pilus assembly protein PilB
VQASLTGHLVLGTLHTNSAVGAVSRLVEMGVPSFFVGTGLIGTVSQRLVRRLCRASRRAYQPPADLAAQYGLRPEHQLFESVGCPECSNLGVRGRIGIQEVLAVNAKLRDAICSNQPESELHKIALQNGMVSMFRDGIGKAIGGLTTIEEVYTAVVAEGM